MNRGSVRVPVHDDIHVLGFERPANRVLIHIHDLRLLSIHGFDMRLASRSHASRKALTSSQ